MRTGSLVCLLFALLSAATAVAQQVPADSAFARKDWPAAEKAFAEVVKRSPDSALAWFKLGVSRFEQGRTKESLADYERARKLGMAPVNVNLRMARAQAKLGDYAGAAATLEILEQAGFNGTPVILQQAELAAAAEQPAIKAVLARMDKKRHPCLTDPKAHELDFWIGKWDVYAGGALQGVNDVYPILEHCVVSENWEGGGGLVGKSMNFYDSTRKHWRQVWVAASGWVQEYTGEFKDGAMRFEGTSVDTAGKVTGQRLIFIPMGKDSLHQIFQSSEDGGKTWKETWKGIYTRHKETSATK